MPDPKWLGEKTADWILAVEKGEHDEAKEIFNDIVEATGVMKLNPSLKQEVEEQVEYLLVTHYLLAVILRAIAEEKTPPETDEVKA